MADTYIIEVGSGPAGIVVRDQAGYRFFAATHDFNPLEGRYFRNARDAERAAMRCDHDRRAAVTTQRPAEAVASPAGSPADALVRAG
jgi:hypothetical protein